MRSLGLRLRAISPVIAMILVVAITLAVAFAVGGWVFGLWGGLAGGSPQISVTNAKVYAKESKGKWYAYVELYIVNKGLEADQLLKVEIISGQKALTISKTTWIRGNTGVWITCSGELKGGMRLFVGDTVLVKVYMRKSGTFTIPVVVSPAPVS